MRKISALVLTVVMLVSMFAGVALAVDPILGEVRLTTTSAVITGGTFNTATISGQITTPQGVRIDKTFMIEVKNESNVTVYGPVAHSAGQFSFIIPTNIYAPQVYTVTATNAETSITPGKLTMRYNVTLNNPLSYTYSADAQEVLAGSVKYGGGAAVSGAIVTLYWLNADGSKLAIVNDGGKNITTTTNSIGNFGQIINGWNGQAGKIGLDVDGVIHIIGEVKPMTLGVTAFPNTNIVHTIGTTNIEVTATGGPTDGARTWAASLYKGTTLVYVYSVSETESWSAGTNGRLKLNLSSAFSDATMRAGTYTVVVSGLVSGKKLYEGSTTFSVINPSQYNLLNEHQLSEFYVGNNLITFGSGGGDMRVVEMNTTTWEQVTTSNFVYTVMVNGVLAKVGDTSTNFEKQTSGSVKITTTSLANVSVRVIAHKVSGSTYTSAYDKTYTVPVSGWEVTYSPQSMTVNVPSTVSFVVRDKNGVFVNNAQVILRHEDSSQPMYTRSPLVANIVNGTYTFTNLTYTAIGAVRVTVATLDYNPALSHASQLDYVRADFTAGIDVAGAKVYTVTSNVSALLVGKQQAVLLNVKEGQTNIIPEAVDYYVDGVKQGSLSLTFVDTNNDGFADSVSVNVTAISTKPITLRARNASGTRMGEVTLTAVAPKLVKTGSVYLTDSIETNITFQIVDPRTNTPLTEGVGLDKGTYIATMSVKDDEGLTVPGGIAGKTQYTLAVKASGIDYVAATAANKVPELAFTITFGGITTKVEGTYQVRKASLTSNPTAFIINTITQLTLSYADANDRPLVGYTVRMGDTVLGKTNAAGQIMHATSSASSSSIVFKAETDVANYMTELTVTSTFDSEAPKITAPASVTTETATITITDNVRVVRLMVNGVEINIFPVQTVNHVVNLNIGQNNFVVVALDANYNVAEKVVTITRVATTPPVATVMTTVIGQRGYVIGGVFYDMAPVEYNANGDSMMPVRMLEAFGATVAWDQVTGTATFTYRTNTVSVTIGSSTAIVNGQAVALIGASGKAAPAYLVPGRTMVPTRFVSERLGFTVTWAPPNTVTITAPQ